MKIAVSTTGKELESSLEKRFGRSPRFLIIDPDTKQFKVIDNHKNTNAAHGAGIQTAQDIINEGVDVVITGNTGPKAQGLLSSSGVEIFRSNALTVADALLEYGKNRSKPSPVQNKKD